MSSLSPSSWNFALPQTESVNQLVNSQKEAINLGLWLAIIIGVILVLLIIVVLIIYLNRVPYVVYINKDAYESRFAHPEQISSTRISPEVISTRGARF